MARYENAYRYALGYGREYGRYYGAESRPHGPRGYDREFLDRRARRSAMGMHDFSEGYGRYSGGPRYGYEYSPRTVEHRHPHRTHTGFTRPLRGEGERYGAEYGGGRRGRGPERSPASPRRGYGGSYARGSLRARLP